MWLHTHPEWPVSPQSTHECSEDHIAIMSSLLEVQNSSPRSKLFLSLTFLYNFTKSAISGGLSRQHSQFLFQIEWLIDYYKAHLVVYVTKTK